MNVLRIPSSQSTLRVVLALGCVVLALGCGEGASSGDTPGAAGAPGPLVDVAWLAARLDDDSVQILDARTNPADFADGRIPGALALSPYELATTVDGVGAQIAPAARAESLLRERGLREGTTLVVYGNSPEFDPTRVVWALSYYGHERVAYLDGGWPAWLADGQPVETGAVSKTPSEYRVDIDETIRVTGTWILAQLGESPDETTSIQLVDARDPAEYRAGRIPGAISIPWQANLDGGFLRPPSEVGALYEGLDRSKTTVVYCLVGWRASFTWMTLNWLGFEDVRLYDGSWVEWGARPDLPIETDDGTS